MTIQWRSCSTACVHIDSSAFKLGSSRAAAMVALTGSTSKNAAFRARKEEWTIGVSPTHSIQNTGTGSVTHRL